MNILELAPKPERSHLKQYRTSVGGVAYIDTSRIVSIHAGAPGTSAIIIAGDDRSFFAVGTPADVYAQLFPEAKEGE